MTRYPLLSWQATAVCNEYQYLKGELYDIDPQADILIEQVTVSPFDDVNKFIFISEYRREPDAAKALELYGGTLFDVLVIGREKRDATVRYKALSLYLAERNIPFDPPVNHRDIETSGQFNGELN